MTHRVVLMCLCSVFFLMSCAYKKNLIVLLPDPDGKVGIVEVSNRGGTQILRESGEATEVKAADVSPTSPVPMEESEISKIFGETLSAQPVPPVKFLLYFQSGTTELKAESQNRIKEVLDAIESRKSKDITIVGHTDRVGTREANHKLGLERTDFIKAILVSRGVDPASIELASHGEDNPLIKTEDGVPEPRNRRIEITVR